MHSGMHPFTLPHRPSGSLTSIGMPGTPIGGSQQLLQTHPQQQHHHHHRSLAGSQLHAQPSIPLLQRVIMELFQTVREYQVNGRLLSDPFMRLPTRSEMPTYYEFIKRPVELEAVAKSVINMRYTDLEEFVADLILMFDNACKFNEPDSQIYSVRRPLRSQLTARG